MLLYRLSQYYYRGYHYYRLTGRFYKIKYSYFEKTRTKKIKQEKPEQHFVKLQLKSSYYMLNRLDRLCHKHDSSEIHWSYFHLGSLEGVMMSFPVIPVHSISKGGVLATKI